MTEDNRRDNIRESYEDGLHYVEYLPEPVSQDIPKPVRGKIERRKVLLVTSLLLVVIMLAGTLAWYVLNAIREIDSKDTEVMTPYLLYLLDPLDEESLVLTVGNLHPGETKQVVLCVSSKRPEDIGIMEISKDSEFSYELELAYTQNLAVDYHVYELELVQDGQGEGRSDPASNSSGDIILVQDAEGENAKKFRKASDGTMLKKAVPDVSLDRQKEMYGEEESSRAGIVNLGQYDLYKKDAGNEDLKLNTKVSVENGEIQYDKDYYLVEIKWKEQDGKGNAILFDHYRKETDLVYVIVKAIQPRPEEIQTP